MISLQTLNRADNRCAEIGHNSGALPADLLDHVLDPTPFEQSKAEIEGLAMEASSWLDSIPLRSEREAEDVAKLLDLTRKAAALAEKRRKVEAQPFDDGKAEVQARYNPLIQPKKGTTEKIEAGCKALLSAWMVKIDAEKAAIAAAARREADEKLRLAQEAIRASEVTDLAAREHAEELIDAAKEANKWAVQASKDTARVESGGRAVGLRSVWKADLTDAVAALQHYYDKAPQQFEELVRNMAAADVRAGVRTIPGFTITEERVAV